MHTLSRSHLSSTVCNASMPSQFINKHIIRSETQKCASNWMEQQQTVNLIVVMRKYSWCVIVKLVEWCWYTAWTVKRAPMHRSECERISLGYSDEIYLLSFLHSWWAHDSCQIVCGFWAKINFLNIQDKPSIDELRYCWNCRLANRAKSITQFTWPLRHFLLHIIIPSRHTSLHRLIRR